MELTSATNHKSRQIGKERENFSILKYSIGQDMIPLFVHACTADFQNGTDASSIVLSIAGHVGA